MTATEAHFQFSEDNIESNRNCLICHVCLQDNGISTLFASIVNLRCKPGNSYQREKEKNMSEILGASVSSQHRFVLSGERIRRWKGGGLQQVACQFESSASSSSKLPRTSPIVRNEKLKQPSTFSSRIATDLPLYEPPGVLFDEYLNDKPRVFEAMFPDKRRSQRLNEDEWRIQMLPIQFLFLTVRPVIDMRIRCKSQGKDYPPGVPMDVTRVVELDIIKWELKGLDSAAQPSHFSLGVRGALYPERQGIRTRLKGQLEMKISFILPQLFSLVPADVLKAVAESVLTKLVENMKDKVNSSLLSDFSKFKMEKQQRQKQHPKKRDQQA